MNERGGEVSCAAARDVEGCRRANQIKKRTGGNGREDAGGRKGAFREESNKKDRPEKGPKNASSG